MPDTESITDFLGQILVSAVSPDKKLFMHTP
jgi:hypothetical protein